MLIVVMSAGFTVLLPFTLVLLGGGKVAKAKASRAPFTPVVCLNQSPVSFLSLVPLLRHGGHTGEVLRPSVSYQLLRACWRRCWAGPQSWMLAV